METLQDEIIRLKGEEYAKALNDHLRSHIDNAFKEEWYRNRPAYHMKRSYGKWTIYDKDGKRIAWRLKKQQADAYMKLLEEK